MELQPVTCGCGSAIGRGGAGGRLAELQLCDLQPHAWDGLPMPVAAPCACTPMADAARRPGAPPALLPASRSR